MLEKQESPGEPYPIHTIETPDGTSVSFSPKRGGIITSFKSRGRELLYLDRASFLDPKKNVRGGVPIMAPNAGPVRDDKFPGLPQHGTARKSDAWVVDPSTAAGAFSETLKTDAAPEFPYAYTLEQRGRIGSDGALEIELNIANRSEDAIPVAMGLHPYFSVPASQKSSLKFIGFPKVDTGVDMQGSSVEASGKSVEECADIWMNGGTVSLANPGGPISVSIPNIGALVLEASAEFQRFWIWSLPGENFICIEPVMRDSGGLVNDPCMVRPGEICKTAFSVQFEEK